jgi:hypothetical protein
MLRHPAFRGQEDAKETQTQIGMPIRPFRRL